MLATTPRPASCPACGCSSCRLESHAEEAGILAEQAARAPRPAPAAPVRTVCCVRCKGSGYVVRGLRESVCPSCIGTGEPVVVVVTADGKAVRVEAA